MTVMEKSTLAAFVVLLVVESSWQQTPPTFYVVNLPVPLCVNYTGDSKAVGAVNPNNPCELQCLMGTTKRTINKKDGEECSTVESPNLANLCYRGKCVPQIASTATNDKGYPCNVAGTKGDFLAIQKGTSPCTLTCVPLPTKNHGSFDSPANYGSICTNGRNVGNCVGTVCRV